MPDHKISYSGFFITFVGAIMFSTKAIIVKKAFADTSVDALTLLTLRMIFSLPFYIGSVILIRRNEKTELTIRQWAYVILLGLLGYYLSSLLDFIGLQYVSAGLERLILFLYPTFVLLINRAVFKEKISRIQMIALLLTYSGIAITYFGELSFDENNPQFLLGSFLIFLCAITYALYISGSGKVVHMIGATKLTAYTMLAATAGIFIHFVTQGNYQKLEESFNLWWYGILLAVVATVIPSFLIANGMKKIGSNNLAIVSSVGPVSTIIQAHFILGEKIFAAQIAGTLLVIAGILLIGWKSDN